MNPHVHTLTSRAASGRVTIEQALACPQRARFGAKPPGRRPPSPRPQRRRCAHSLVRGAAVCGDGPLAQRFIVLRRDALSRRCSLATTNHYAYGYHYCTCLHYYHSICSANSFAQILQITAAAIHQGLLPLATTCCAHQLLQGNSHDTLAFRYDSPRASPRTRRQEHRSSRIMRHRAAAAPYHRFGAQLQLTLTGNTVRICSIRWSAFPLPSQPAVCEDRRAFFPRLPRGH